MISKIKKTYSRKKEKKNKNSMKAEGFKVLKEKELVNDDNDTNRNKGLEQFNMNSINSNSRQFSLPSDYGKDSFDALLFDRTQLRQKKIIKKNINASYNRNSYIENSQDKSNKDIFNKKLLLKNTIAVSTPLKDTGQNDMICAISPIQENKKNKKIFNFSNSNTLPSITFQFCDSDSNIKNKTDHESITKLQLNKKFESKNLKTDKKDQQKKSKEGNNIKTKKIKEVVKLKKISNNKLQDATKKHKKRKVNILKNVMINEKIVRDILMKSNMTQHANNKSKLQNQSLVKKNYFHGTNTSAFSNTMNIENVNLPISIEKLPQSTKNKRTDKTYNEQQVNLSKTLNNSLNQSEVNITQKQMMSMNRSLRVVLFRNELTSKLNSFDHCIKKCKVKLDSNALEKYQRFLSLQKSKQPVVNLKRLNTNGLNKNMKFNIEKKRISVEKFVKYISNVENVELIEQSVISRSKSLSKSDLGEIVSLITPTKCRTITHRTRSLQSLNMQQNVDASEMPAIMNNSNNSAESIRVSSYTRTNQNNSKQNQLMETNRHKLRSSLKAKQKETSKNEITTSKLSQFHSNNTPKLAINLKSKQINTNRRKNKLNKKESAENYKIQINSTLPDCSKCNQCVHQLFNSMTQYSERLSFLLLKDNIFENVNRIHESPRNSTPNIVQFSISNETSLRVEINDMRQKEIKTQQGLNLSRTKNISKTNVSHKMVVSLNKNEVNKYKLKNNYEKLKKKQRNKSISTGKENENREQDKIGINTRRIKRKYTKSTTDNTKKTENIHHFDISIPPTKKIRTIRSTDSNDKSITPLISNRSKSTEVNDHIFLPRKSKLKNRNTCNSLIVSPLLPELELSNCETNITQRMKNSKTVTMNTRTKQNHYIANEIDESELNFQNSLPLLRLTDIHYGKNLRISTPIKNNNENIVFERNPVRIILPSGKWRKSLNILKRKSINYGTKLSVNRKTIFLPPTTEYSMSVIDEEHQDKTKSTIMDLTKCEERVQRRATRRISARNALKKISENVRHKTTKNKYDEEHNVFTKRRNTENLFENSHNTQRSSSNIIEASYLMQQTIIGSRLLSKLSKSLMESHKLRKSMSMKEIVFCLCEQSKPIEFSVEYSKRNLQNCNKIGEGVYGEVFMNRRNCGNNEEVSVLKIIPIEGDIKINGETQKKFDEIVSELIIAKELSNLRNDKNFTTSGFVEVKRIRCVKGKYPKHLIKLWENFDDNRGSENDHPDIFPENQLYIVMELANGGQDLEAFVFESALQSYSAFLQTVFTLAVAEEKFKFEHRDLHWGNILLTKTEEKEVKFRLNGQEFKIPTHGVQITIIDYTLSRMMFDDYCFYNDLSSDNDLFSATGDYQFEIYRLMRDALNNEWTRFEPYTNILWLHYVVEKIINGVRYRYTKTEKHLLKISTLMVFRDNLLSYKSVFEYIDLYLKEFINGRRELRK